MGPGGADVGAAKASGVRWRRRVEAFRGSCRTRSPFNQLAIVALTAPRPLALSNAPRSATAFYGQTRAPYRYGLGSAGRSCSHREFS